MMLAALQILDQPTRCTRGRCALTDNQESCERATIATMYRYSEQPVSARRTISGPRPPRSGSQSLERGLDILEMSEAESGDIGVRELARRLELSPTIVQRLVSSLAVRGYIEKNLETS